MFFLKKTCMSLYKRIDYCFYSRRVLVKYTILLHTFRYKLLLRIQKCALLWRPPPLPFLTRGDKEE